MSERVRPYYSLADSWDIIDAAFYRNFEEGVGFCRNSIIAYVDRAGRKSPLTLVEDLTKAKDYIDRWIKKEQERLHD